MSEQNKYEISITHVEPAIAISIRDNCTVAELGKKFGELYGELGQIIKKQNLKFASHLFGIYHNFRPESVDVEAGIPISGNPEPEGRMRIMKTYGGKAVCLKYYGPYDKLSEGWSEILNYVNENSLNALAPCFEVYVTDPGSEPDSSKWLTELYFPVK
jgi:effector-binding domain-containing protein